MHDRSHPFGAPSQGVAQGPQGGGFQLRGGKFWAGWGKKTTGAPAGNKPDRVPNRGAGDLELKKRLLAGWTGGASQRVFPDLDGANWGGFGFILGTMNPPEGNSSVWIYNLE